MVEFEVEVVVVCRLDVVFEKVARWVLFLWV